MMARWKIRLSYGARKEVRKVNLTTYIIQGDDVSLLLFVLMVDLLIKAVKKHVEGIETEILFSWTT